MLTKWGLGTRVWNCLRVWLEHYPNLQGTQEWKWKGYRVNLIPGACELETRVAIGRHYEPDV
jgi:hypothetical protein